jgi:hypothetical protein
MPIVPQLGELNGQSARIKHKVGVKVVAKRAGRQNLFKQGPPSLPHS